MLAVPSREMEISLVSEEEVPLSKPLLLEVLPIYLLEADLIVYLLLDLASVNSALVVVLVTGIVWSVELILTQLILQVKSMIMDELGRS